MRELTPLIPRSEKMIETNIKDLRERHKTEIKLLRDNCPHKKMRHVDSIWEKRTMCVNCGKLLKRVR